MYPPYTFEEILLILEEHMMNDLSQRLRELWEEKQQEIRQLQEELYDPHKS
jgi:hypothetical protein